MMMIRRADGNRPVRMLRHELDRLFDGFAEGFPSLDTFGTFGARTFPAVNVWEDGATLYAEAEIPGLAMDQVDVSVLGDELTIKGERKDVGSKSVTHHRRERGVGSFVRVLRLPVEVDADKVEATLRDGVLTISLPKAQAALPRKIEVKG